MMTRLFLREGGGVYFFSFFKNFKKKRFSFFLFVFQNSITTIKTPCISKTHHSIVLESIVSKLTANLSPILSYRCRWIKPNNRSKAQSRVDSIGGWKSSNPYGSWWYKGTIWFHWKNAKSHARYGCLRFGKSFFASMAVNYIPTDKPKDRAFTIS